MGLQQLILGPRRFSFSVWDHTVSIDYLGPRLNKYGYYLLYVYKWIIMCEYVEIGMYGTLLEIHE